MTIAIKNISKIIFFLFFFFQILYTQGQSIISILNSKESAKAKCERLEKIADASNNINSSLNKDTDSLIYVWHLIDSLARTTSDAELISHTIQLYVRNITKRKNDLALQLAYENLEICQKHKDCKLTSLAYALIANVQYWGIGNVEKGKEYFEMAMKEAESCNDKKTLLEVYGQSENIYFNTQDYEKTKQILLKEQKVDPSLKQDAQHYASFGDIFRNLKILDSADYYYLKAIKIAEDKKDSMDLTSLYFNYVLIPMQKKDYKKALTFCKKGLEIAKKIKFNTMQGYYKLYNIYRESGDYINAKKYLQMTIEFDEFQNCVPCLINKYRRMSELNYEQKNYKDAYLYLIKNNELFFDQNNAETSANLTKVEEDNLKKQKQLEINIINQQKESEKRVKNISFVALAISFTLILGIIFSLVKINKSKKLITLQQLETEKQKHLVEEKQKEILDSITYAKRLQEAILPPNEFVNANLVDNFIYYQPKDIVAGDFYWAEKVDELFFIAAADSTGHGVPGALVSVVCSNALNRTIKEFKLTETGKILDKTRELVLETFEKSASEVKDGMDISLLCIDSKNKNIFWSGANNPLWYIQDNELKEIKADKQPIGKSDYPKPFTTHQIEYKADTTFYLFTDGFADQFGGPNGKKFKYKQFSDLLIKNNNLSQSQQADIINKAFTDWKGDLEQVDDVCVIGIKL